jgi:PAS domain-containing protein
MDVFIHIPKTGGSTIRTILSREYGVEHILYYEVGIPPWKLNRPGEVPLPTQLGAIDLLTGHTAFGVHELIKQPCRYFSLVRDPLERVISDYFYAFTDTPHRWKEEILSGALSVDEFVMNPEYGMRDEQVAYLKGTSESYLRPAQAALDNISTGILTIGLTERFQESLLLMAKLLGWKPPLYRLRNVTKLSPEIENRRRDAMERLAAVSRQVMQDEYEVYRAVDDLLSERMLLEGELFDRAQRALHEIQENLSVGGDDAIYDRYILDHDLQLPENARRYIGSEPYRVIEEYLRAPIAFAGSRQNLTGFVDSMSAQSIEGWALDLASPSPIEVVARRGGDIVGRSMASLPRPDVKQTGIWNDRVGFRIELDHTVQDISEYRVCLGDTSLYLPVSAHAIVK